MSITDVQITQQFEIGNLMQWKLLMWDCCAKCDIWQELFGNLLCFWPFSWLRPMQTH